MENLTEKFQSLQSFQTKAQQELTRVEAKREEAQKSYDIEVEKLSKFGVSSVQELKEKRETLEKALFEDEDSLKNEIEKFEFSID